MKCNKKREIALKSLETAQMQQRPGHIKQQVKKKRRETLMKRENGQQFFKYIRCEHSGKKVATTRILYIWDTECQASSILQYTC